LIAAFKSLRTAGVPDGFAAPLVNLLDGLLSGAGLCLALSLDARLSRRTS